MKVLAEEPIGNIVSRNSHAADIFDNFGMDYCCQGGLSLEEACRKKGVAVEDMVKILENLSNHPEKETIAFDNWPLDLLIDYIEKKHHRYVETNIPVIKAYLDKVVRVHGKRHPALVEVRNLFYTSAGELTKHMKKEELMLFPFVRKMVRLALEGKSIEQWPLFHTVRNPVNAMLQEHDAEGSRFEKIRELTKGYQPPEDACLTYRTTLAKLAVFEKDLHRHVHLENHILFPKALELEKKLSA